MAVLLLLLLLLPLVLPLVLVPHPLQTRNDDATIKKMGVGLVWG
jgi:hypothetical protein